VSYQIDASLQQGVPTLRLLDANSGQECLFWQMPVRRNEAELRDAWRALFRHLVLLSCINDVISGGNSRQQTISIKRHETGLKANVVAVDSPREKTGHTRQSNVVFLPLRRTGAGR